ncbi:phage shock protein operon transcriptional activator [Croceicoccus sp. F390]|uniref:Phage shock protein operon transcriptional activator n=1 Tax=Croceicoccus esteveae TaxID=3075597 RepID=A0ABU2ZHJ2_9SPHN|nr:phage shock protein operon transcriptional activator [Croceicoccus sp. F390]MDT0576073.1 phage shock protein operon transcriptional activator [Croceicoccus sp. F390]
MDRETQLIGQSSAMLDAVERASRAAALTRPVLIVGERGTGKELIAERLHRLSDRWGEPLVVMNCAALPESLMDAELFGHEAGSFTGATRARAGRFEEAHGGTLFLDELGSLSAAAQDRLLRAVEYGEVTRIGASRPRKVDVRIVAATNANLPAMAGEGRFRADLLDRLSFEVITLPPLRAREGDVAVLADFFAQRMAAELHWTAWPGFTPEALTVLERHGWPGNVRELRNVVERAVYRWDYPQEPVGGIVLDPFQSAWAPDTPAPDRLAQDSGRETVDADAGACPQDRADLATADLATADQAANVTSDLRSAVAEHERALLKGALERHRWNRRHAAKALGLTYDQLRHDLRRHGLSRRSPAS